MELNLVITVLDRSRLRRMEKLYQALDLHFSLTMLGRGTASAQHLLRNGLRATEKAVTMTVAAPEATRTLLRAAKEKLYIDIPGNGIMTVVPVKSVGGGNVLSYLTEDKPAENTQPKMEFKHELIFVILNEGFSEMVMDAAVPAGASGGTVVAAKGTGMKLAQKFLGITLAEEKEIVLIVARADKKADIMRAIIEKAGVQTKAGAICFSLPVTQVAGLRQMEEEEN